MNTIFDKNPVNLTVLLLQVIYSMENHQSSYYSVSYELTGLKICHYTVHKKVAKQHI